MGFLGLGGNSGAPAAVAAPPPPPPAPPPPPTPASAPVQLAGTQVQKAARAGAAGGSPGASMSGTLLTGPAGAPEPSKAKNVLGSG